MRNHPIIVQKYGGACLETPAKIRAVASDLADLHGQGNRVVVIVSAMGKTTDQLIEMAYQVSPRPNRRELDMLLTTGERISMSLMSMALSDLGVPAISFTGSQAGVMTDASHSAARILDVRPVRVREELDRGRIVVLAGFQGVNPLTREITTLGRGGSDTTAVAMAAALKAERCEIVKEVDGICSADPRIVGDARPLRAARFCGAIRNVFLGCEGAAFSQRGAGAKPGCRSGAEAVGRRRTLTQVMKEVAGMESGKVLAVNSIEPASSTWKSIAPISIMALRSSPGISGKTVCPGRSSSLQPSPRGKTSMRVACDSEWLDALLRTLAEPPDLRRQREASSSVSLTCFGGVSSDLPFRALQLLARHGIVADSLCPVPAFGEHVRAGGEPAGRGEGFACAGRISFSDRWRTFGGSAGSRRRGLLADLRKCQAPRVQNISLYRNSDLRYAFRRPAPLKRGDAHRHVSLGAGCDGRAASGESARSVRRSRVVLAPRPWRLSSPSRSGLGNGDNQRRSPGRARRKPSNHCAGKAGVTG